MEQSKLSFTNPIIEKLNYNINLNFESRNGLTDIVNSFKVNIKRVENKNEAWVELNIIVGQEGKDVPFYIDLVVCAAFRWEDCYDDKTLQDLLSINAPALLLGYESVPCIQFTFL